jgi:hypothetical protein
MILEEAEGSSFPLELDHVLCASTEVFTAADPWEYMSSRTVPEAYDVGLYEIRLSTGRRSHQICRNVLENERPLIQPLVDNLFRDVHSVLYDFAVRKAGPTTPALIHQWNECYERIYGIINERDIFDIFLDILPFFLTHIVIKIYCGLPVPLGIGRPSRIDVARRVVFLFSSVQFLDSHLEMEMRRYFGEERILAPVPAPPPLPAIILPLEDLKGLVDLERRPRNSVSGFNSNSRSPIAHSYHFKFLHQMKFIYPPGGEIAFGLGLKRFSRPRRSANDDTKSLLMRARCHDIERVLKQTQMEAAVSRTNLVHRFAQDQQLIETKRQIVLNSPDKLKDKFMEELRESQSKGIRCEDPQITMELLRNRCDVAVIPVSDKKKSKMDQIVDTVLRECVIEDRRRNEPEVHCTHEFRNKVLDVRHVFDKPTVT